MSTKNGMFLFARMGLFSSSATLLREGTRKHADNFLPCGKMISRTQMQLNETLFRTYRVPFARSNFAGLRCIVGRSLCFR